MKTLYFDCSSGISGNMTLGALTKIIGDENYLINELKKLNIDGYKIEISKKVTGDENVKILEDDIIPKYKCDCSKEHMKDALISIGKKDLEEILKEDGQAELMCHFCNKKYIFSKDELEEMIKNI